jgi:hypothetical protein
MGINWKMVIITLIIWAVALFCTVTISSHYMSKRVNDMQPFIIGAER